MALIIGCLVVVACTFGGYVAMGGKLGVLWQPFEVVIIVGAAIGAFIVANTGPVLKGTMGAIKASLKGPAYKKDSYIELLGVLYQVFKLAKTKGNLALEQHIENPEQSAIFQQFPAFAKDVLAAEHFDNFEFRIA